MSEPIPESIPTSSDPRSKRPTKRLALTPTSHQASQLTALFAKPDREITLPPPTSFSTALSALNRLAPPPEIVANVQGSSAGAGSGEFHVYKASRRREYERLRLMDEEVKKEKEDAEFDRVKEERRTRDEEKSRKNRAKREKKKAGKGKKGKGLVEMECDLVEGDGKEVGKGRATVTENKAVEAGKRVGEVANGQPAVEENGVIIHDDD